MTSRSSTKRIRILSMTCFTSSAQSRSERRVQRCVQETLPNDGAPPGESVTGADESGVPELVGNRTRGDGVDRRALPAGADRDQRFPGRFGQLNHHSCLLVPCFLMLLLYHITGAGVNRRLLVLSGVVGPSVVRCAPPVTTGGSRFWALRRR